LLPVPAGYSDRVLTNLDWVEFGLLPSFAHRSGANPEGASREPVKCRNFVSQLAPHVDYKFWRVQPARGLERRQLGSNVYTCDIQLNWIR
jgi:hypothetical protein